MTKGNTTRLLLRFALPLMLGSMLQQVYILADTAIVGKYLGYRALAALGSSDWLTWLMNSMINGLTMGYCVKASQEKGRNSASGLRSVVAMCIVISVVLSVILLITGQLIARPALLVLQTPDDIIDRASIYLRIIYLALPITLFYNTVSALLRSVGDSKTPFVAMLFASIINILLDLLFVIVFSWGIAGAAIATVIAQCFSLIVCVWKMGRNSDLKIKRIDLHPDSKVTLQILRQSLPIAFQFCIVSLSGLVIQFLTNQYGSTFIAGYTAANKYYGLVEIAAIALASALLTYSGQNFGAENIDRIKKGIKSGVICSVIISLGITIVMIIKGRFFLSFFISGTPEEIESISDYAYQFLMFISIPSSFLYMHHVLRSILQGIGDVMTPIISGLMQFIFRILSAFTITHFIGSVGVFAAEPCAWGASACFLVVRLTIVMKRISHSESHTSI